MKRINCEDCRKHKCACCTACCSLCCLLVCLPIAIISGQTTYRSIGCLFGWGIAASIVPDEPSNLDSWDALNQIYRSRFWLGQSALVVGLKDTPPSSWYVTLPDAVPARS